MKLYSRDIWESHQDEHKGKHNCPLCHDSQDYEIHQTQHWKIVHNKFPILGLKTHIMAVPKRHIILAKDLNDEEYLDYKNVERYVYDFFGDQAYFTFMRESVSGRSLEHLHYHFLPGMCYYQKLEEMLLEQGFRNELDS